ncbi:HlyD family secretion protein [Catalinimonas alkaloidigena]|uniref:efflux RND transporter periplasmic adaptor subunit n=1 Tax=Catalinimonas alkaloidigena TaxID=1075417 RepID=UPI00240667A7|nr:efflux RND transporter periplasmic adaptor subunit [Catalinimonas alkaloidigena]MDF9795789.1 HlyD family secretion protein [Catalinimonas alkaloidigena]
MLKKILIPLIILIVAVSAYYYFDDQGNEETGDILTEVKRTSLKIDVTVSGELQARNSVEIRGPMGMQRARIYQANIEDIVPEGTVVEKGDYVARLDNSELSERISSEELDMQESQNAFEQTQIDTAITLREQREKMITLGYEMEQKKLTLEQSQYEPPATIKQAELELEKAKRAMEQAKQEYNLLLRKSKTQMAQASADLQDDRMDVNRLKELNTEFVIRAPENGMVIYERERDGRKKGKGSQVRAWDPVVATLPDLSSMISRTYVNEVDISRINVGQQVEIGLDAFPEKRLTGEVTDVANVGEQRPNSDAKVFEVSIRVNESDTTLRPAMTTSNMIITNFMENVLVVPLEAIQSQGDTLVYVFKRSGLTTVKQQVALGPKGNDVAVVSRGLEEEDVIYLSIPDNPDDKRIAYLDEEPQPLTEVGNE